MKTPAELHAKIEEAKDDLTNTGKVNSEDSLAFQQGFIEALRWVLR